MSRKASLFKLFSNIKCMAASVSSMLALILLVFMYILLPTVSADSENVNINASANYEITSNVLHAYWEEPGFFNESYLNLSTLETAWIDKDTSGKKSTEASPSISEVAITSGTKMATTDHVRATATLADFSIPTQTLHYELTYTLELYEKQAWPFPDILRFSKNYKRFFSGGYGPSYTYDITYDDEGRGILGQSYTEIVDWMTHLKNSDGEYVNIADFTKTDSGKQYFLRVKVGSLQKDTPVAAITVVDPPTPYVSASLSKIKKGGSTSFPVTLRNTGGDPKYCYFSPSFSGGLTYDSSGTSIVSTGGSSIIFSDYPPGSTIKNNQGTEMTSTYELLDTRILPATGGTEQQFNVGVKTTASASVGGSQWIYYRYTCTTPTMDPTDLIANKKNYPTSSSYTDQQGWKVGRLSVSVYACDTNSDCGSSGWTGSNFCSSNDVYRTWTDYQCLSGGGTSSSCQPTPQNRLIEDCGDDSCDGWGGNYCSGDAVYHSRTCHDRGCSSGSCNDNAYAQEEIVKVCMKDIYTYTGEKRWVSTGQCTESEQERIVYSQYTTCSGSDCVYKNTDLWDYTGAKRNKADSTACNDGQYCTVSDVCSAGVCGGAARSCSTSDLPAIATCINNPDANPFTWDYFTGFVSACNEATDACTTGTVSLTHTCSVGSCGAECDSTHPCQYARCLSNCTCTLPGDVNGDWKVDIKDLAAVGKAYGSVPGSGNWNANADFNGDWRISLMDLVIVGKNFGRLNK
jgi:hypothetical protein